MLVAALAILAVGCVGHVGYINRSRPMTWDDLGKIGQFAQGIAAAVALCLGIYKGEDIYKAIVDLKTSVYKLNDITERTLEKVEKLVLFRTKPPEEVAATVEEKSGTQFKSFESTAFKKVYWTTNLRGIPEKKTKGELIYLPNKEAVIRELVERTVFAPEEDTQNRDNLKGLLKAVINLKASLKVNEDELGPGETAVVDVVSERRDGGEGRGYKIIATKRKEHKK